MAFVCGQLEELYMSCSRKDMSDTLTEVLLAACVTPTLMPDRLLMEHVLLVSILHHAVGLEVSKHPLILHFDVYNCQYCVCQSKLFVSLYFKYKLNLLLALIHKIPTNGDSHSICYTDKSHVK